MNNRQRIIPFWEWGTLLAFALAGIAGALILVLMPESRVFTPVAGLINYYGYMLIAMFVGVAVAGLAIQLVIMLPRRLRQMLCFLGFIAAIAAVYFSLNHPPKNMFRYLGYNCAFCATGLFAALYFFAEDRRISFSVISSFSLLTLGYYSYSAAEIGFPVSDYANPTLAADPVFNLPWMITAAVMLITFSQLLFRLTIVRMLRENVHTIEEELLE